MFHRIANKVEPLGRRGYITPALEGEVKGAAEVERAVRDITLGVLDSKTAYADNSLIDIYLHSPQLNRATVLKKATDAKGKPFGLS